ncbi:TetR/AcrR family transcriptional regulator [Heyndrickxia acidicola]|uniref:TetR/AcrR family transcriptional regulator n=1 Tax=Heyndrickxia acidicola TaxID=209389 RepID=A0ABU6ML12_9BACI|nr:TetR/AcrR family transcriptional regulator [Heyndrickxia acidicola]MED1204651.1 TetR/AcrR family transcriptional regulator [Heyndrickxia acidicola]
MVNQQRGRAPGRPKASEIQTPKKELILQVASRLFLEHGFQKVSIDDVAKAGGMTKATVYYYYGSKAELFKETMVAMMARVRERIRMLIESDKPLYDRLMDVTVAHLHATTSLDLDSFMRESKSSLSDEQVQDMLIAEERMFESIEAAIQDAIDKGEIPPVGAKFAAHAYNALLRVGNYKSPEGTPLFPSTEETAGSILKLFWNGLMAGPFTR